jgi:hypothetical protein
MGGTSFQAADDARSRLFEQETCVHLYPLRGTTCLGSIELDADGLMKAFDAGRGLLGVFEDGDDALNAVSNGRDAKAKTGNDEEPSLQPGLASDGQLTHDKAMTKAYLTGLDPTATRYTFQTFDDNNERKDPALARVLHGTLDEVWPKILALNTPAIGAGVFVTINETDFRGRSTKNIVRVRALFGDADGDEQVEHSTAVIEECNATPSMIVESGGGQHYYYLGADIPLDQFSPLQKSLARKLGTDRNVHDLPRVMRLPGTLHLKDPTTPRLVKLLQTSCEVKVWKLSDLIDKLGLSSIPDRTNGKGETQPDGHKIEIADAFKGLDPTKSLGEGIPGSPLLPLEPLLKECAFIRTAIETGGKDYTQPMWNLTTLCAVFLEDGHALAHRMGNQHPGYLKAKTDELWVRKNREHKEKGVGWPSCKAIKDDGCTACEQCPHLLEGKSPLNLALPGADLPTLVIGHDPTAVAKELAKLIAPGDHYFFNGNAPVRIAAELNDMPRAIEVTAEHVRVLAHELSRPVKQTNNGLLAPTEVKTDVANIYLRGLEGCWGLKHFAGIATTPILSSDGTIRSMDGYDPITGLWCHNIPVLDIPSSPTGQEASAALLRLRRAFRTFAFADAVRVRDGNLGVDVVDPSKPAGLDESAALMALLTAACRPSLNLAPGFLCDAPTISGAGTGKGLLVKAVCIVASGASPPAFTGGHDESELDKRLTAALIQARPAIFLDNFNAKELSSDALASALTENPAQVRIMGLSKMVPLHVCTFIGITGTGVKIAEDMARRLLNTHLDAKMENPEERNFKPGFLNDVFAQRSKLLSDLLTIWRWGRQTSGALTVGRPLGSYEIWAQWVRDPLLTLGLRDPVDRIAEIKASDPRRRTLIELFDLWYEKHEGQPVRATKLDPDIIQLIDSNARKKDDGTLQHSRQKVARFLTQHAGTRLGGYVLTQGKKGPESKPVAVYTLVRTTPEPASDAAAEESERLENERYIAEVEEELKKTHRGSARAKSDDLPYAGPTVPVPESGADSLDEHGVPTTQAPGAPKPSDLRAAVAHFRARHK